MSKLVLLGAGTYNRRIAGRNARDARSTGRVWIASAASAGSAGEDCGDRGDRDVADRVQGKRTKLETVEPLGKRVLIRKDEDKKVTKGGIALPDSVEIPTITGRVVAVSAQIDRDEDFPIKQYDRVLFNPKNAIPVEFDTDNFLYVVPIEDVVAVFRAAPPERPAAEK